MSEITFGGALLVNGPVPQPPDHNLLTVARLYTSPDFDDVDERWAMGASIWPYSPDLPSGHDPCADGTFAVKGDGTSPTLANFAAFTGYLSETCTARGISWDPQGYADRAVAAFAGLEYWALEKQLMSGTFKPTNPWITDLDLDIIGGGVVGADAGLEYLEDAIAATGRKGVIHAEPSTIVAWARNWQVFEKGSQLVTMNGTPVVSGYGYLDSYPIAQGPGSISARKSWAYATGPILYQRGDRIIQLPGDIREALDRTENTVTYRAERDYLVAWDKQLQVGVNIDRSL